MNMVVIDAIVLSETASGEEVDGIAMDDSTR